MAWLRRSTCQVAYLKKGWVSVPYYLIWWLALILTDQDNALDNTKITASCTETRFRNLKKHGELLPCLVKSNHT